MSANQKRLLEHSCLLHRISTDRYRMLHRGLRRSGPEAPMHL